MNIDLVLLVIGLSACLMVSGQSRHKPTLEEVQQEIDSLSLVGGTKKFCSDWLRAFMKVLCAENSPNDLIRNEKRFYNSNNPRNSDFQRLQNVDGFNMEGDFAHNQKRLDPQGVIMTCCLKPCTIEELRGFCGRGVRY